MGTIPEELHQQVQAICIRYVKACAEEMAATMSHISSTPSGAALAGMQQMMNVCAWSIGSSISAHIEERGDFAGHDLETLKQDILESVTTEFEAGSRREGTVERIETP